MLRHQAPLFSKRVKGIFLRQALQLNHHKQIFKVITIRKPTNIKFITCLNIKKTSIRKVENISTADAIKDNTIKIQHMPLKGITFMKKYITNKDKTVVGKNISENENQLEPRLKVITEYSRFSRIRHKDKALEGKQKENRIKMVSQILEGIKNKKSCTFFSFLILNFHIIKPRQENKLQKEKRPQIAAEATNT